MDFDNIYKKIDIQNVEIAALKTAVAVLEHSTAVMRQNHDNVCDELKNTKNEIMDKLDVIIAKNNKSEGVRSVLGGIPVVLMLIVTTMQVYTFITAKNQNPQPVKQELRGQINDRFDIRDIISSFSRREV